ncbi:MAG: NnrS family protein [Rhodocyclales bacterium]|nr:NnrS family protein [Rhodocyclales bacterium]
MKPRHVFFAAPHRVMFFAGLVQALLSMLLWAWDAGGRWALLWPAPLWPWPPAWLHSLLMIYGTLPFFMFGFAMTAGPRWQGARELAGDEYLPPFALMAAGWLLFYAGLLGLPALVAAGLGLVLAGWLWALRALWRVLREPAPAHEHIACLFGAFAAGALGLALFLGYAAGGAPALARAAIAVGVWGLLLPAFATVAHRMVPFFTASAIPRYTPYQPPWTLRLVLAAAAGHLLLALAEAPAWLWLADLPAAAALLYQSWRWQSWRTRGLPMLSMLHLGCAWIGVALALFALQSLCALAGTPVLGLAPLHALTVGGFASLLLAMGARVALGHSGQAVKPNTATRYGFWALQAATLARMAMEWWSPSGAASPALAAALLWLLAWGIWAASFAPSFFRPRADGQPG